MINGQINRGYFTFLGGRAFWKYRKCDLNVHMPISGAIAAKVTARRRLPAPVKCKAIRVGSGVTQADVAESIVSPVSRDTVARWGNGSRTPRGETLDQYVDILEELREIAE